MYEVKIHNFQVAKDLAEFYDQSKQIPNLRGGGIRDLILSQKKRDTRIIQTRIITEKITNEHKKG